MNTEPSICLFSESIVLYGWPWNSGRALFLFTFTRTVALASRSGWRLSRARTKNYNIIEWKLNTISVYKKKTHTLWKHPTSCSHQFLLWQVQGSQKSMKRPNERFWPNDLDLWPMTLTYKLDLDILPLDLHAEIQVRISVRSAVRVVTHTQTHTQTHDVKTITPITSETWGVIRSVQSCIL